MPPTGKEKRGLLGGDQLSSVPQTKVEWLILLVIKLNESPGWIPPLSRQKEKFTLDCPVSLWAQRERGQAGWINGLHFASVVWGTGGQAPGSLGSLFWENSQNWRVFNWCKGLQTESAGSPRANTDVMASGQRKCRDKKATGHTRYEVWPSGGHQVGARAGQRAGINSRKPTQQTQVWRSSTRPSGNFWTS